MPLELQSCRLGCLSVSSDLRGLPKWQVPLVLQESRKGKTPAYPTGLICIGATSSSFSGRVAYQCTVRRPRGTHHAVPNNCWLLVPSAKSPRLVNHNASSSPTPVRGAQPVPLHFARARARIVKCPWLIQRSPETKEQHMNEQAFRSAAFARVLTSLHVVRHGTHHYRTLRKKRRKVGKKVEKMPVTES